MKDTYKIVKQGFIMLSHWLFIWALLFLCLSLFPGGDAHARGKEDLRSWAGLELFPSLLAADLDIARKPGDDGKLLLVLLYKDSDEPAASMASHLSRIGEIRGLPLRVELASVDSFIKSFEKKKLAGIFLTQRLPKSNLEALILYTRVCPVILFSPFEGDVERGVHGGILVSDRVLPYINKEALQRSGIDLKPFFLQIAEIYEKNRPD